MTDPCPDHHDALAFRTVTVALVVVANKPFYPLYIWWFVGSGTAVSLAALISMPAFAAIALVAKRRGFLARAAIPVVGVIDTSFLAILFGRSSGTMLFFGPCMMLAALSFRPSEAKLQYVVVCVVFTVSILTWWFSGAPVHPWSDEQLATVFNINAFSVAGLMTFIGLRYAGIK